MSANGHRGGVEDHALGHVAGLDPELVSRLRLKVADDLALLREQDEARGRTVSAADERQRARHLIQQRLRTDALERVDRDVDFLGREQEQALAAAIHDAMFDRPDLLRQLDRDGDEELVVNGYDNVRIFNSQSGWRAGSRIWGSNAAMVQGIQDIARRSTPERRFDGAAPFLDLRLPDGSRLNASMEVSPWPTLTIRRYLRSFVTLKDLRSAGSITLGLLTFFIAMVRAKCNVVVGGGTASGKTTMLRALANAIHPDERLVTVEDALELGLHEDPQLHNNVVPFEVRQPNVENEGAVGMGQLMHNALRMRPDRVLVGEVRDYQAASAMLLAMSQGNDGSMCSVHASDSEGVFERLRMYTDQAPDHPSEQAVAKLIAGALHFVIYLDHAVDDGRVRRFVSSVREVAGSEGGQVLSNEIYGPGPDGRAVPTGVPLTVKMRNRLVAAGFDPAALADDPGWPA